MRALRPLAAAAALGACSDATGPGSDAPVEVAVAVDSVHLTAVGETRALTAVAMRRRTTVTAALHWYGTDDSVATVDASGQLVARGAGRARVFVFSDSGGVDSLVVRVAPVAGRARITRAKTRLVNGRRFVFAAEARDAGDGPVTSGTVSWSSTDPSRVAVDASGEVRGVAPGTARVRATVEGFTAETTVTVVPAPRLRFVRDTIVLGNDQRWINDPDAPFLLAEDASLADRALVTMTFSDSSVASGPAVSSIPHVHWSDIDARIEARRPGTTAVTVTAPGWQAATAIVIVTPSRLRRVGPASIPMQVLTAPAPGTFGPIFELADSLGVARDTWRRAVYRYTTSDPSVLALISDSLVLEYARWVGGPVQAVGAGRARLVVQRAGYGADSVDVDVRPAERVRIVPTNPLYSFAPSPRMTTSVGHHRRMIGVHVPLPFGAVDTVRLRHLQPQVLALSDTLLPVGGMHNPPSFATTGLALGTDTIIASVAGHGEDTLIVDVVRPSLWVQWHPVMLRGLEGRRVGAVIAEGGVPYGWLEAVAPVELRLMSSDTSVLRPLPPYWLLPMQPGYEARKPGVATLRVESVDGRYEPLDLPPIRVVASTITIAAYPSGASPLRMGTRTIAQVASGDEGLEWMGAMWMRARSTDTSIVKLIDGDSIQVGGMYALVESGATPGHAWIVIDGEGVVPESLSVQVTASALAARGATPLAAGAMGEWWASLELIDAFGAPQFHADSTSFEVTAGDATILAVADRFPPMPRWGMGIGPLRVNALRAGTTTLRVRDLRAGPRRFADIIIPVTVNAAPPP